MALADVPKGATVRTDADGEYVAYHRRCGPCGCELTSRNRTPGGALRCKPCAQGISREVWAERVMDESGPKAPRMKRPKGGPERQAIYNLLTGFLVRPTVKEYKDALLASLVDYELKERFRNL